MTRVLALSWEYPPNIVGGISRHVEGLSEALAKGGLDVHVITAMAAGAPEEEEHRGVHIHRVPVDGEMSDFLPWVRSLNHYMERKADELLRRYGAKDTVLHAHDWLAKFAGQALKNAHKMPLLATVHATEHGRNYGIYTDMQRYISHLEWELSYEAWRVIVCSAFMRDEVTRILATPLDKIDIIPNGIDASAFDFPFSDRDEFRRFYAADNEKIVFHVGRNVREKGAQVLIDAFKRVLHEFPNSKLVIAGGGDRGWLKDQAVALGIADRVYFTGFVSDEVLARLYRVSDVAVFPSLYEPFGIVALEGMAAKVPVVISNVPGLGEVVDHGVTGVTTYVDNPESLAWGICDVLRMSPADEKKMTDAAYEKATTVFSWDRVAEQTREVYDRVLAEHEKTGWK